MYKNYFKRLFDIILSLLLIILILPFLIILSLLLLIDSGYPVIFKQKRIGKNLNKFTIYKFKTINRKFNQVNSSKLQNVIRKLSLDEFPQLINVLIGNMSLVGPRPHLPEEVAKYEHEHKKALTIKILIKPLIYTNFNSILKKKIAHQFNLNKSQLFLLHSPYFSFLI